MNADCLKLTSYFGERDRVSGMFLADAFTDIYARHQLATSLVMRGVEGFGPAAHLRTDRLLSLSEDLPIVSVAVDTRPRIEAALGEIRELRFNGLLTLERAHMLTEAPTAPVEVPWEKQADTKLTIYVGRQERIAGRPAYEAIVAFLHDRAVAGATVLLGVDGTAHGTRQRAKFFARNAAVPLMVISVGDTDRILKLLPDLAHMLPRPLITLERIRVCKRDGHKLAEPRHVPDTDPTGLPMWQKLMIYTGEQAHHNGQPLHRLLIRELRTVNAAGATNLRGIWGYHGNHQPHGDSFWQLRRRVPILTIIVDTPTRIRQSFTLVDQFANRTGLVTSEMVPAVRATAPHATHGRVRLARRL